MSQPLSLSSTVFLVLPFLLLTLAEAASRKIFSPRDLLLPGSRRSFNKNEEESLKQKLTGSIREALTGLRRNSCCSLCTIQETWQ